MKKNLFFCILITFFVVFTITSCGDEKKEDLNYKKACELKDFSTAYEIVDKLKEKTSEAKVEMDEKGSGDYSWVREAKAKYKEAEKVSQEAERYVVLQEAITVLEENGENGLLRIVGISKEHHAESWLFIELLDVVRKIGDSTLVEKIQNITGPIPEKLPEGVITPESLDLSGPLKGYFKIVEKQYSPSQEYESLSEKPIYEYYIEFVRLKEGFPGKKRYSGELTISYLGDNDNIVFTEKKYNSEIKELLNSEVGGKSSVRIYVEKQMKASKFRITSTK